mmetsp:Transcript_17076/g.55708  ORF Transcript_17076/g.55708 Transcript_17076/m.55708 type:complete len:310 (+) Transcript_17076:2259-3188(+)
MPARPQRRREDDHAVGADRALPAQLGRLLRLRPLHPQGGRPGVRDDGHLPAARRAVAHSDGARARGDVCGAQGRAPGSGPAGGHGDGAERGADRQGARPRPRALGRHEAQAICCVLAHRRLAMRAARRAHLGDGSRLPPVAVGAAQVVDSRARASADHALHGRGGRARRPDRRHVHRQAALRRLVSLPQVTLRARVYAHNGARKRRVRRGAGDRGRARSCARGRDPVAARRRALLPAALLRLGFLWSATFQDPRGPGRARDWRVRHVGHLDGGGLSALVAGAGSGRPASARRGRRDGLHCTRKHPPYHP